MVRLSKQPDNASHLPPEDEKPTLSPSDSFYQYVSGGRIFLAVLTLLVVGVMAVGIIFVAHQFYKQNGGQGFLRTRTVNESWTINNVPELFLPLRKLETTRGQPDYVTKLISRTPGKNVPFYACGDQQESCESYDQPNICCPVQMICYPSLITSSNVYCCNSSAPAAQCRESARQPPQCLPDTRRCTDATGGGCCPNSLICSPNGCIQIKESSIIGPSSSPQAVSGSESIKSLTAVQTDPATVTVTQIPAATVTMAKEAEVAQKGDGSKQSVILSFCVPYVSAWSLLCVAVLMGMM